MRFLFTRLNKARKAIVSAPGKSKAKVKETCSKLGPKLRALPGAILAFLINLPGACVRTACATPGFLRRTAVATPGWLLRTALATPGFIWGCFRGCLRFARRVIVGTARYVGRNWKPLALLSASAVLLIAGFVRLSDYNVPMLRHDWETAGKGKTDFSHEEKDDRPPQPMYAETSTFDKVVVASLKASWQGIDFVAGDRTTPKFNNAFSLYQEGRYDDAIKAFNKAYAACHDSNGQVKDRHRILASEIQLMIGNAFANQKKTEEAINAYQLSLTYDPNNIVTIYNLERLLSNGGGKGGGDKGEKPKGNPINTKI